MEETTDWSDIGRRKHLADRVALLGKTQHEQILRILHSSGIRYTRNKNGVFCDITRAPVSVLELIEKSIEYSAGNSQLLEEERRNATAATAVKPFEPKERRPPPVYRPERVKAFATSMARTKTETSAQKRKESCKYQQLRKKYSREVSCKTVYNNELKCE